MAMFGGGQRELRGQGHRRTAKKSALCLLEDYRLGRKVNLQPIFPQQSRAKQNLAAFSKSRFRSNHVAIKSEVYKEDVFLNSLIR
ncbi:MAG TPA: hypothetical protein VG433_13440, partial [Pirellulales bacterium]|nr:hypothetical protein [Pirellulales bacterium]